VSTRGAVGAGAGLPDDVCPGCPDVERAGFGPGAGVAVERDAGERSAIEGDPGDGAGAMGLDKIFDRGPGRNEASSRMFDLASEGHDRVGAEIGDPDHLVGGGRGAGERDRVAGEVRDDDDVRQMVKLRRAPRDRDPHLGPELTGERLERRAPDGGEGGGGAALRRDQRLGVEGRRADDHAIPPSRSSSSGSPAKKTSS